MFLPRKGLKQAFAAVLQVSPSLLSQIKKLRPIGDKLARQIGAACGKHHGRLDEPAGDVGPDEAEEAFVELARQAWRRSNARQKKALMRLVKGWPDAA